MKKAVACLCMLGLIASVVLIGCSPQKAHDEKVRASLAQAARVFNNHDFKAYAEYYADDFQWDPVGSKTTVNRTDFIAMLSSMPKDDPAQYHFQAMTLVSGAHGFFDGCSFVSTNPATKKPYRTFHVDMVDFQGMKTKVMTTFADGASEDVALGLIEPPIPVPPLPGRRVWPPQEPQPTGLKPLAAQAESLSRWNSHDLQSMEKMLGKDAQVLYSMLYDPVNRNAFVGWAGIMFAGFPDLRLEATRTYELGDGWVVSEVAMTGTNSGPYLGSAPTGKPISLRAAYLGRYDSSGLATNLKLYFDSRAILSQLGRMPTKVPIPKYMVSK